MEHLIPEQVFSTEQDKSEGISAEGQRIWTITRDNLSSELAAIDLGSDIESEIRNAVLAGKVATAHEQPISFAGGTNIGYLLVDPETGAGAYLIAGGVSGALIATFLGAIMFLVGMFVITNPLVLAAIPFLAGPLLVSGVAAMLSGLIIHLAQGGSFNLQIFSIVRLVTALLLISLFTVSGSLGLPLFLMLLPVLLMIPSDSQN